MKAVRFHQCGDPAEVLKVEEIPEPVPGPGQLRVRMLASPLNPSDLLYVRGMYGRLPSLPATPGFEGVGVVEANGGGILGRLRQGRRVAVLNGKGGNWQEHVIVPARQVVPVPADIPDDQAASFFVNPASALVMVRHLLRVRPGSWLLQTAAGSALGRMVIRLGKTSGFRTINVVRRHEQAEELRPLGADAVISTDREALEERVLALTNGTGVPYAMDAVGGATGSAAFRTLAPGGRLVVYGALSGEPLSLDLRSIITGERHVEGFWLSLWVGRQRPLTMLRLFRQVRRLIGQGVLQTEVGTTFPLEQVQAAAREAEKPGRQGKVILRIRP